ncbi:MAG: TetR/AcrR family transcriptional regulator [Desulfobacterales bacterium]|nr:TetR/AcrR family transcriptional regulator [Desulfobacterales bacterium]
MTRKEMIFKAATVFFAEKGYRECSMAELAHATDVAQSTIFYHYKTKEDLFLAILKKFREDIIFEFTQHTSNHVYQSGLAMAEGVIAFYLQLASSMEERFLLLHRHDAYELARTNDECREHLEAIYDCLVDMFDNAIHRGQEDGSVRPDASRNTAMILFSMVDSLVRLQTYQLYDAGSLYGDLNESCQKILKN